MSPIEIPPPYGGELWKVARVDLHPERSTEQQRAEAFAWLDTLGVPYRECTTKLTITSRTDDGKFLLHLSRFLLDAWGHKYIDHAANAMATAPYVVAISDFPAWLVQASQLQDQQQEA